MEVSELAGLRTMYVFGSAEGSTWGLTYEGIEAELSRGGAWPPERHAKGLGTMTEKNSRASGEEAVRGARPVVLRSS